jgi:hypothetical protein
MILTSLQNPKMKQAVALRDRKDRDETALLLNYNTIFTKITNL